MKNIIEYKGYHAKIEFDSEDMLLRGKIEGINDLVTFEAENTSKIEHEFQSAVDDYLEFCKEVGKEPDKEYKGTFNVRISPELHKKIALKALKDGDSLNSSVEKAISEYVSETHEIDKNFRESMVILAEALKTESTYSYQESLVANKNIPYKLIMEYSEELVN